MGGKPFKHGHYAGNKPSRTWSAWHNMKDRCDNPKNKRWNRYGGRGITYDPYWVNFANFLEDMGECPEGLTLERKDTNGPYSKNNCRWATVREQAENRSSNRLVTKDGVTKPLSVWCRELGVEYTRALRRHRAGKPLEYVFATP